MSSTPRITVVGCGMAGASLAYMLAVEHGVPVTLLEREPQPGMHSTGRSAALYMPSYGPPGVRAATIASGTFYRDPPAGFAAHPLLTPRGALHVAFDLDLGTGRDADPLSRLDTLEAEVRASGGAITRIGADDCLRRCPVLLADAVVGGAFEDMALDMDVDAILQGFLRGARRGGATVRTGAALLAMEHGADGWTLHTAAGTEAADIVVNAAGAWADAVGALAGARPVGLQPKRRSAFLFNPPDGVNSHGWPAVIDAAERFYFKPDAGLLLGSLANADPVPPHDVLPEELDIATGIWAIEQATTLRVGRPRGTWAGLRSFVPDGEPICGFDPHVPGLFWLAGQGGYGIQSAPGLAWLAAALVLGKPVPDDLQALGLQPGTLSPGRLFADSESTR